MKKAVMVMLMVLVYFSFGNSVMAASSQNDYEKVLESIAKTNQDIDEKVRKAVEEADKLNESFLSDVREVEEGKEVVKLKEEKEKKLEEMKAEHDEKKHEKLKKNLSDIENRIAEKQAEIENEITLIQEEIEALSFEKMNSSNDKEKEKVDKKLDKLYEKLNKRSNKMNGISQKYQKDLDVVITKVYDDTLKMSQETIEKAAEKGVIAECSWKHVRFADRWVWIDPIRVVGYY
ncbi:hypothetical protein N5C46_09185 [Rossellomorea vietnamensis]|uniref:Uncharacterized protein n=1 Tax=Rossellomorea vietnamensis TaxID=218284 RepID=A0ACD4CF72_9BACI|nr:hypothetical protein [Rossellomorea vietnamensis]UXH46197.1 hypothetical protein N5C46_09185 [Rossellomorea vietnamensis]